MRHFLPISEELSWCCPSASYERDGNVLYNTVAVLDCGKLLGVYRKTHIPDDHYYQEKFYFTPADTGFRVWDTTYGKIGVGICWDQWFPETARCLALGGGGADFSIPPPSAVSRFSTATAWSTGGGPCRGHAAANVTPVIRGQPLRSGGRAPLPGKRKPVLQPEFLRLQLLDRRHRGGDRPGRTVRRGRSGLPPTIWTRSFRSVSTGASSGTAAPTATTPFSGRS